MSYYILYDGRKGALKFRLNRKMAAEIITAGFGHWKTLRSGRPAYEIDGDWEWNARNNEVALYFNTGDLLLEIDD